MKTPVLPAPSTSWRSMRHAALAGVLGAAIAGAIMIGLALYVARSTLPVEVMEQRAGLAALALVLGYAIIRSRYPKSRSWCSEHGQVFETYRNYPTSCTCRQ